MSILLLMHSCLARSMSWISWNEFCLGAKNIPHLHKLLDRLWHFYDFFRFWSWKNSKSKWRNDAGTSSKCSGPKWNQALVEYFGFWLIQLRETGRLMWHLTFIEPCNQMEMKILSNFLILFGTRGKSVGEWAPLSVLIPLNLFCELTSCSGASISWMRCFISPDKLKYLDK
jgi:hypothetical protein